MGIEKGERVLAFFVYWLPAAGFWLPAFGFQRPVFGFRFPAAGCL